MAVELQADDVLWQEAGSCLIDTVCNLRSVLYALLDRVAHLEAENDHMKKLKRDFKRLQIKRLYEVSGPCKN